jgi:hypothetical protein
MRRRSPPPMRPCCSRKIASLQLDPTSSRMTPHYTRMAQMQYLQWPSWRRQRWTICSELVWKSTWGNVGLHPWICGCGPCPAVREVYSLQQTTINLKNRLPRFAGSCYCCSAFVAVAELAPSLDWHPRTTRSPASFVLLVSK